MMFCSKCGGKVTVGSNYCPKCGRHILQKAILMYGHFYIKNGEGQYFTRNGKWGPSKEHGIFFKAYKEAENVISATHLRGGAYISHE